MNIIVDFYMPPHLFDSARGDNNYESVTERIAKVILKSVLGYQNVHRGDPQVHEPDYVCGEKGFEVTLAESGILIPQLRGRRPADGAQHELEDELIRNICNIVQQKSKKHYDRKPVLIVLTLSPIIHWYHELWQRDPQTQNLWGMSVQKRNSFFKGLNDSYISGDSAFENIYLLQPTLCQKYALYDLKAFAGNQDFIIEIGIRPGKEMAFPTFKVKHIEGKTPLINYTINPVQYRERN